MAHLPRNFIPKGFWEELLPRLEVRIDTVLSGCSVEVVNEGGPSQALVHLTVAADAKMVVDLMNKCIAEGTVKVVQDD